MEKERQLPARLREPLRELKAECDRGSEMTRCFLDTGESNDLDLLISWMHNQFLKPILYGLEEEMSRSRLENWLEHLQKQSARFRELTSAAKHPNKKKFAERWNSEIDTAISLIREQLRRLEDSTRDYL